MRNARIGQRQTAPQPEAPKVTPPSPLAAFVDMLFGVDANRDMFGDFGGMLTGGPMGRASWQIFLEDLHMLLLEKMVVGLRNPWLRRVAMPVWMAHRHLSESFQHPDEKVRAGHAIEILGQCIDEKVRAKCIAWIREVHNV